MTDNIEKSQPNLSRIDLFVRLLMANHKKIYFYIFCMVPNWSDADDIMQEVTTVMLNRFNEFEEGSNFVAWGKKIALYEVFKFRRKQKNTPLYFDDDKTLELISGYINQNQDEIEKRSEALHDCIQKLTLHDKQLIVMRYEQGASNRRLASQLNVHVSSIYRKLERIHRLLMYCIRQKLTVE